MCWCLLHLCVALEKRRKCCKGLNGGLQIYVLCCRSPLHSRFHILIYFSFHFSQFFWQLFFLKNSCGWSWILVVFPTTLSSEWSDWYSRCHWKNDSFLHNRGYWRQRTWKSSHAGNDVFRWENGQKEHEKITLLVRKFELSFFNIIYFKT